MRKSEAIEEEDNNGLRLSAHHVRDATAHR
jgi:hypothetical protein